MASYRTFPPAGPHCSHSPPLRTRWRERRTAAARSWEEYRHGPARRRRLGGSGVCRSEESTRARDGHLGTQRGVPPAPRLSSTVVVAGVSGGLCGGSLAGTPSLGAVDEPSRPQGIARPRIMASSEGGATNCSKVSHRQSWVCVSSRPYGSRQCDSHGTVAGGLARVEEGGKRGWSGALSKQSALVVYGIDVPSWSDDPSACNHTLASWRSVVSHASIHPS